MPATPDLLARHNLAPEEYDRIVPEHDLAVVDASRSITEQQRVLRKLVSTHLEQERA